MKIAINNCYGGFSLSEAVFKELGIEWDGYGYLQNKDFGIESDNYNEWRKHPKLISAIEKIGEENASGRLASIKIIDVPDGIEFEIDDYDGMECINEAHRSWYP